MKNSKKINILENDNSLKNILPRKYAIKLKRNPIEFYLKTASKGNVLIINKNGSTNKVDLNSVIHNQFEKYKNGSGINSAEWEKFKNTIMNLARLNLWQNTYLTKKNLKIDLKSTRKFMVKNRINLCVIDGFSLTKSELNTLGMNNCLFLMV